ncbi:MAG TPA: N-acetyltransferase [Lachnospiraceae bacterium]|nr:N-acetyltransferase [Lachnospiraceae bacterium]
MENVKIIQANPKSEEGGKLNRIALDYMAYPLVGSKDDSIIEKTLQTLWGIGMNRFSHQFAYEAQVNLKTVGMITCYPVIIMNQLAWPTFRELIKLRKWSLVEHSIAHLQEVFSMINLKEGREDEFHIGTLATLPESRGYGIGSKLINYAENLAMRNLYHKCSLTVKKENEQARRLYEKMGYHIVDSIEKKPYSLYRMVKNLI